MQVARIIYAASFIAIASAGSVWAQAPALGAWEEVLSAFAAADREKAPPPGGTLFVGSSSIRLWDTLESDFGDGGVVIKRGFGGSRLTDCVGLLDRLVLQYRPRQVILYAGDNDLAEGRSPQQVLEQVKAFAEGVHSRLPETNVVFISIKPSPARIHLIRKVRAANELVMHYADAHPRVDYVDVFSPMLTADGTPRRELFRDDALHLNRAGYALWHSLIAPFVRPRAPSAPPAPALQAGG